MKKIIVLLLSVVLLFSLTACGNKETETVGNGTAKEKFADIEWTMENGVLTIRGEGMMPIYEGPSGSEADSEKLPPWYEARDDIKKVVIEKGITSIGDLAFLKCKNLTEIEIPDSVKSLGEGSFQYCASLSTVEIPDNITRIGGATFFACQNLMTVKLPDTVTQIDVWAFAGCESLTTIEIPESVTEIGKNAFNGSDNLTICGASGSYAEKYATENNIPFEAN